MNIRIGDSVKTKLTLSIDAETVETAKKVGLNISQFVENALKIGITALENANRQIASIQTASNQNTKESIGNAVSDRCGRRDLNPGSQAWKACVLTRLDDDRL